LEQQYIQIMFYYSHIQMAELFISLLTTSIIVGLGLLVHVVLGFLKTKAKETPENPAKFSKPQVLSSVIIGSLTGLILVLPQVENMEWDTDPIAALILAVTLLATVAGIDAIAKNSGRVAKLIKSK